MVNPFLKGNALKILNPVISSRENLAAMEEDAEAMSEETGSNPKPDGGDSSPVPGEEHLEAGMEQSEPSHAGEQAVVAAGQEPKATGNHKASTNDFELKINLESGEGSVAKICKTDGLNVILSQPPQAVSASASIAGEQDAPENSMDADSSKATRDKTVPGELMKEPTATTHASKPGPTTVQVPKPDPQVQLKEKRKQPSKEKPATVQKMKSGKKTSMGAKRKHADIRSKRKLLETQKEDKNILQLQAMLASIEKTCLTLEAPKKNPGGKQGGGLIKSSQSGKGSEVHAQQNNMEEKTPKVKDAMTTANSNPLSLSANASKIQTAGTEDKSALKESITKNPSKEAVYAFPNPLPKGADSQLAVENITLVKTPLYPPEQMHNKSGKENSQVTSPTSQAQQLMTKIPLQREASKDVVIYDTLEPPNEQGGAESHTLSPLHYAVSQKQKLGIAKSCQQLDSLHYAVSEATKSATPDPNPAGEEGKKKKKTLANSISDSIIIKRDADLAKAATEPSEPKPKGMKQEPLYSQPIKIHTPSHTQDPKNQPKDSNSTEPIYTQPVKTRVKPAAGDRVKQAARDNTVHLYNTLEPPAPQDSLTAKKGGGGKDQKKLPTGEKDKSIASIYSSSEKFAQSGTTGGSSAGVGKTENVDPVYAKPVLKLKQVGLNERTNPQHNTEECHEQNNSIGAAPVYAKPIPKAKRCGKSTGNSKEETRNMDSKDSGAVECTVSSEHVYNVLEQPLPTEN